MAKEIGARWGQLDSEAKQPFEKVAQQEKIDYAALLQELVGSTCFFSSPHLFSDSELGLLSRFEIISFTPTYFSYLIAFTQLWDHVQLRALCCLAV